MWEGLTKKWVKKTKTKNILPSAGPGTRQRSPLPSATRKEGIFTECRALALGKDFFLNLTAWAGSAVKCHFFAECHSLLSVALGKEAKIFAECRALCGTRQSHSLPSARLC